MRAGWDHYQVLSIHLCILPNHADIKQSVLHSVSSKQFVAFKHLIPVKRLDHAGHAGNGSKAMR